MSLEYAKVMDLQLLENWRDPMLCVCVYVCARESVCAQKLMRESFIKTDGKK